MNIQDGDIITTDGAQIHSWRPKDGARLDVYSASGELRTSVKVTVATGTTLTIRQFRWYERLWYWLGTPVRKFKSWRFRRALIKD
jgi:hypothetical protein